MGDVRRIIGVTAAALLLLTACETIRPEGPPSGNTPVVFVHGWNGSEATWDEAVEAFLAAGYTTGDMTRIYYPSDTSAAEGADLLAAEVDHLLAYTGATEVDIVSHSFGSMVTRYCITLGDCADDVGSWVSLAGADNGTTVALACSFVLASCADMAGTTSVIDDLAAAWGEIATQDVDVTVLWSPTDTVILPATNSLNPAPAVNLEFFGTGHTDFPRDADVLATVLEILAE